MKTPITFWILAILAILWFAGGAFDYLMVHLDDPNYMAQLSPEHIAWLETRPTWFTAAWAISIWSSVLAALLMVLRRKLAGQLFALSLVAYVVASVWSYALSSPTAYEISGTFGLVFGVAILASLIFFVLYCATMARRGILN